MGCMRSRVVQLGRFDGMYEARNSKSRAGLMGCMRIMVMQTGRFDGMYEEWAGPGWQV